MNKILALAARFVPGLLPAVQAFLNPWVIVGVLAVLGFVGFKGYQLGRGELDAYIGKQAVAAAAVVVKQGAVTERVITKYLTKIVPRTEYVIREVEKEVIRYEARNPGLCLDPEWRVLHDAAALNAVSGPAGGPDGAGRAPAAPAEEGRSAEGG